MFSTWKNLSWNIVDTDIFHYLGKRYCISIEKLYCRKVFWRGTNTWKIFGLENRRKEEKYSGLICLLFSMKKEGMNKKKAHNVKKLGDILPVLKILFSVFFPNLRMPLLCVGLP
jgi:hypothetical protein